MVKIGKEKMTLENYIALPADDILCDARLVLESGNAVSRRALASTIRVYSDFIRESQELMMLEKQFIMLKKERSRP